jgi:diguanylate cyclase (GGDEF)-like protein/PAS domain S-box-containing protein
MKQSLSSYPVERGIAPSILIVDDSQSELHLVETVLKSYNYETHSIRDPTRTLQQARSILPELILLDVKMPGMDGFEVCAQLKADPVLHEIPVLFLTSMDDVEAKVLGFEAGGNDYLVKPVDPAELLVRVTTQLKLRRTQLELASKNQLLKKKVLDLEEIQITLLDSEARTKAVLDNAAVGIAVLDIDGRYEMINDLWAEMFCYTPEEVMTMHCWDILHPDFIDTSKKMMEQLYNGDIDKTYAVKQFRRKDGSEFWGGHWVSRRLDHNGICNGFVCVISDLTQQRKAEDELRLAHTVFETSNEAVLVSDGDNRIVMVNPAFTRITGYRSEQVIGKGPGILKSGRHDKNFYHQMWESLRQKDHWQGEIWNRRQNGEIYPQWLSISVVRQQNGSIANYVTVFSDITERKRAEEVLRRQALYDPLTRLPNRILFDERLRAALSRARRQETIVALLFIDLDDFKAINDNMGHLAGDQALQLVADCISKWLRQEDVAARLGGDEFAVILTDINKVQQIFPVVKRLLSSLAATNCPNSNQMLSASVGIALFPQHGDDTETLIRNADDAMYVAKQLGKKRYHLAEG